MTENQSKQIATVRIQRFNPEKDKKPAYAVLSTGIYTGYNLAGCAARDQNRTRMAA